MPAELRAHLEESAKRGARSLHAEILARLEATIVLDDVMAERRAGDYREVADMLLSVMADNDRMTASGEQTFSTAYSLVDSLLDKKLAPLVELLQKK
jgi:hypothetical protein